jgi:hypothetical protein
MHFYICFQQLPEGQGSIIRRKRTLQVVPWYNVFGAVKKMLCSKNILDIGKLVTKIKKQL